MLRDNRVRFGRMPICGFAAALLLLSAVRGGCADVPPIGSQTSDGFTVSAWWTFYYKSKAISERRTGIGPLRSLDAPLNYEREVTGDAIVTEEVNKSTNQLRAVIRYGLWSDNISGQHYTSYDGERVDCGPDAGVSGKFKTAVVGYSYDDKTKKPMVSFGISADDAEGAPQTELRSHPLDEKNRKVLDEVFASDQWKTSRIASGVSGGCHVFFKAGYLYYRKRTPEDGSPDNFKEIIIERSARNVEAEIKASDKYKEWVPVLDTAVGFEAHIVDPPGLPAEQWHISLDGVSKLPGVCNNAYIPPKMMAAWQHHIDDSGPDLIFDFRKYGLIDKNFQPVKKLYQNLYTAKPMNSVGFAVSCLDWGASGRVAAQALVDGHWVDAVDRETKDKFIRIPWAPNDKLENHMAMHAKTYAGEEKYYARDAKEDLDDKPVGAPDCHGDGLTNFQEYRGFYVRDGGGKFPANAPPVFERLDPDKKDVFIFMDDQTAFLLSRYLADFQKASGLAVHRIGSHERWLRIDPAIRLANFNSEKGDDPQHAIQLHQEPISKRGVWGDGQPRNHYGPPRNIERVRVDYAKCVRVTNYWEIGNLVQYTVVHELGHAVGIAHHGETDKITRQGFIAMEGGQHSGNGNCPMKYPVADFYLHKDTPAEPFQTPQTYDSWHDHLGLTLCTSLTGTLRNDKSLRDKKGNPTWYCGDADRGNCAGQIMVNDKCKNPNQKGSTELLVSVSSTDTEKNPESKEQPERGVSAELNIRGGDSTIVAGESVVLDLQIVPLPQDGQPASQKTLGDPGRPWINDASLKLIDSTGKETPLKIRHAGSVQKISADPKTAPSTASAEQLKIDTDAMYSTQFVIDGADTEKLSGKFRIVAAIPLNDGPLSSSEATLEVKSPRDLPPAERARLDARRSLANAQVAFADERFADAERLAREVIAREPRSFEAHLVLARSLARQDKSREAYGEFGNTLELSRPPAELDDEAPYEIIFEMQQLADKLGIKPEPPKIAAGPLAAHSLFAESAGGKLNPPFPSHPDQLIFEWQLDKASNDPPGVRWIAADVAGVEKDHVVATAKSDPNKQSGQFSLSAPTAGFPPGQYRVEVWQAGKMIYSEKFEIRSD